MIVEIKHRVTGAVLYSTEVDDGDPHPDRTALVRANLADANLADAYLARANLAGADLARADLAGADLADAYLADAYLARANLAGADLARADLAGADLARANLADANLADAYLARANLADANLADAYLARANLAGANLARADLARADLAGADLADADLARANLARANLAGADLARANLAGADLAGARGLTPGAAPAETETREPYVWTPNPTPAQLAERADRYRARHPEVPVVEQLDAKILAAITADGGRLEMNDWHTCDTTHCRGGWATTLAGKAGAELERQVGVQHAAAMIYRASTGRVPHFFATNERALEDIKACAAAPSRRPTPQPQENDDV